MAPTDDLKKFFQGVITTPSGWFNLLKTNDSIPEEWFRWPDELDKLVDRIFELDGNLYFSPHLFKEPKSIKANVLPTRTIVADLDNAEPTSIQISPTYLVETSPARHQGYWIVSTDVSNAELEIVSKKLSYTIPNCDHSGWSLGHRFRIPFTKNYKYDTPAPVRLISGLSTEKIYQLSEIVAYVGDTEVNNLELDKDDNWINNPPTSFAQGPRETLEKYRASIGTRAFSYYANKAVDRSEALWALMMALFRAGATRDEVYNIASNSENNKFSSQRYSGIRDLAKDVDRAEKASKDNKRDVRAMVVLAEHTTGNQNDRKRLISKIVISDLISNGDFVRTNDGSLFYIHKTTGRPISVSKHSERLESLLDSVYGLNQSDGFQPYVVNHLISFTSSQGRLVEIRTLSTIKNNSMILHSGKGEVYRITPDNVSKNLNGQSDILFPWRNDDAISIGEPLEQDWIDWLFEGWFTNLIDFTPEQAKIILRVWILFVLFKDESVSRPIMTILGQPGSGKSTLFRIIYALFYGANKSIAAISTPDDFDYLVATDPLVVFDNVDTWTSWIPDRLALSASSSDITKRKLYTDNDIVIVKRQALIGLTAHDPRFGRADVVDRMIILTFKRRDTFEPEKYLIQRVLDNRAHIWGSIVKDIQKIIAEPQPNLSEIPTFRISDFARIGVWISKALGFQEKFNECIELLKQTQVAFSLNEEDILVDVIKRWHGSRNGTAPDKFVSVGHLWETFDALDPAFQKVYRSSSLLSRRLWTMQSNLNNVFKIKFEYDAHRGTRMWKIDPL